MRPIGVVDAEWSCGYGKTFVVDGLPLVAAWGGGSYTPRAAARVGRLLIREGDWDGRRLLTRDAVRQITGDAGLPGGCGMGFWTNAASRYSYLPTDACWGAGAGDQVLLVVPSLNLIVVRNGETLPTPDELKQARPRDVLEEFHDPRARILSRCSSMIRRDRRSAHRDLTVPRLLAEDDRTRSMRVWKSEAFGAIAYVGRRAGCSRAGTLGDAGRVIGRDSAVRGLEERR